MERFCHKYKACWSAGQYGTGLLSETGRSGVEPGTIRLHLLLSKLKYGQDSGSSIKEKCDVWDG